MSGFVWSGSSAVVDIFREFRSCFTPTKEILIVKDNYGLSDLCHSIFVRRATNGNATDGIKNFMKWMNFLYAGGLFEAGYRYKDIFGDHFKVATQNFIDSIITIQYELRKWPDELRKWPSGFGTRRAIFVMRRIIDKMLRVLHTGLRLLPPKEKAYFSFIDKDQFLELSRKYLDDLFSPVVAQNSAEHVVLDQCVSVNNIQDNMSFFRDIKLITVDRDPRDNYSEYVSKNTYQLEEDRDVNRFIKIFKYRRRNINELKNNERILPLRFEDLIFRYDESLRRIADFAGLNLNDHVHKREFFDPDVSIKNAGMWKTVLSPSEAETIASELPEFLYDIPNT